MLKFGKATLTMRKCLFSSGFLTDPVCFVGSKFFVRFLEHRAVRSQETYADVYKQTRFFSWGFLLSVENVINVQRMMSLATYILLYLTCI